MFCAAPAFWKFWAKCAPNPNEEQVERHLGFAHVLCDTCAFDPTFHKVLAAEHEDFFDTPRASPFITVVRQVQEVTWGMTFGIHAASAIVEHGEQARCTEEATSKQSISVSLHRRSLTKQVQPA